MRNLESAIGKFESKVMEQEKKPTVIFDSKFCTVIDYHNGKFMRVDKVLLTCVEMPVEYTEYLI